MPEKMPQTFANHARFDPVFHFILAPLTIIAFVLSIVIMVRTPGLSAALGILLTIALFLAVAKLRAYPLRAQDRVIRLEERLRLAMLAPESFRPRITELTEGQLVALRFASDAELPALAKRALDEGLTKKQIKAAIQSWRADTFRV
jgi:alkylhydroperoxidase/carboxymuconolactone decarboxylase family protein YurZ